MLISNKAVKKRKKKQLQRQSVEATNFQRISDQKERDHFELPLTITHDSEETRGWRWSFIHAHYSRQRFV